MGRALTPQELEDFNERRRKDTEAIANKLGMTVEQYEQRFEAVYEKTRRELSNRPKAAKEETETALRMSLDKISLNIINPEELFDETDVDDMSKEDFSSLLALRMSILDDWERTEAAKVIARKIACWRGGEDEPLSLREEILLTLQAMIGRHNYYAEKS